MVASLQISKPIALSLQAADKLLEHRSTPVHAPCGENGIESMTVQRFLLEILGLLGSKEDSGHFWIALDPLTSQIRENGQEIT